MSDALISLTPGQRILNRYRLKNLLGRGGFGVVWLAHDEELRMDVALKFISDLIASHPDAVEDLRRETRFSLRLTHPYIVRIFSFFHDAGLAGISMEYMPGGTLVHLRVSRGHRCFGAAELSPWVAQLCEALEYAHTRAKIIHRDLKPANLMLDSNGDLKVADFGISRSLSDTRTRLTNDRGTSGTLSYMSPQQLAGESPSASDDVYALGATIYDLLSGKPPFHSGDIVHQVLHTMPPSIAKRRFDLGIEEVPPVPETWESVIAACLDKEESRRPSGAAEVATRLGLRSFPAPSPSTAVPGTGPAVPITMPISETIALETATRIDPASTVVIPPTVSGATIAATGGSMGRDALREEPPTVVSAPVMPAPAIAPVTAAAGSARRPPAAKRSRAPVFVFLLVFLVVLAGGAYTAWQNDWPPGLRSYVGVNDGPVAGGPVTPPAPPVSRSSSESPQPGGGVPPATPPTGNAQTAAGTPAGGAPLEVEGASVVPATTTAGSSPDVAPASLAGKETVEPPKSSAAEPAATKPEEATTGENSPPAAATKKPVTPVTDEPKAAAPKTVAPAPPPSTPPAGSTTADARKDLGMDLNTLWGKKSTPGSASGNNTPSSSSSSTTPSTGATTVSPGTSTPPTSPGSSKPAGSEAEDPEKALKRGYSMLQTGRYEEARAIYRSILAGHPGTEHAARAQGQIVESYFLEKNYAEVHTQAKILLERHGSSEWARNYAHYKRARTFNTQKDYAGVLAEGSLVDAGSDWRSETLFLMGNAGYLLKRYDEALAAYTELSRRPPGRWSENVRRDLGWTLHMLGRHGEAVNEFQAWLTANPDGKLAPDVLWGLATSQIDMGRTDDGKKTLADLVNRFPDSPQAQDARAKLERMR